VVHEGNEGETELRIWKLAETPCRLSGICRAILQKQGPRGKVERQKGKFRTANKSGKKVWLGLARHEVDVVVIQCRACEHGAVRVEGRAGDGGGAVVMEEARIRLEGGEVCAIDVVGLYFVAVGTPIAKKLVNKNCEHGE
jgi:hypothetical protein